MKKVLMYLSSILVFLNCTTDPITLEKVKNGEYLETAEALTVDQFFQIWVRRTIPWKANCQITEAYKDSTYTYFFEQLNINNKAYLGNRVYKKGSKVFKVNTSSLDEHFKFYNDFDPTGNQGFDIKKETAKALGLQKEHNQNQLIYSEYKLFSKNKIEITVNNNDTILHVIYYNNSIYLKDNKGLSRIVSKKSDLKAFVSELEHSNSTYRFCEDCAPLSLNSKITGYTDRVRPTGNYFKKELEIGSFDYDAYSVSNFDELYLSRHNRMYVCYFSKEQKEKFTEFFHYYRNFIGHGKGIVDMKAIGNTVVVQISYI